MNLYFKLLLLIIRRAIHKVRCNLMDRSTLKLRVGVLDLDLNFHMNNGRFLSTMDLGRMDLLMKTGHFIRLFKNGYYPVILSESIVFNKSLDLFQQYDLETQIQSFDEKFFYIEQKFVRNGTLVASANVRACFKKRGVRGVIPVESMFEFLNETKFDLPMSELANKQIELDNLLSPRNK